MTFKNLLYLILKSPLNLFFLGYESLDAIITFHYYLLIFILVTFIYFQIKICKKVYKENRYDLISMPKLMYFIPLSILKYIYIFGFVIIIIMKVKYKKKFKNILFFILLYYEVFFVISLMGLIMKIFFSIPRRI